MLGVTDMNGSGVAAIIGLIEVLILILLLIEIPSIKRIKLTQPIKPLKKGLKKIGHTLFRLKKLFKPTPLYFSITEDRKRSKKY